MALYIMSVNTFVPMLMHSGQHGRTLHGLMENVSVSSAAMCHVCMASSARTSSRPHTIQRCTDDEKYIVINHPKFKLLNKEVHLSERGSRVMEGLMVIV